MISKELAEVYHAPTRGRRYFTLTGAIKAEAKAMILRKYPVEHYEPDTGHSYYMPSDEEDRYNKIHKRLSRFIFHRYCNSKQEY